MGYTKVRKCRICKRTAALSRINAYRICDRCQPEWKEKNEQSRLMTKLLAEAYERLTESSLFEDTVCEICGRASRTRRLSVDHNHRTLEVRGLLCYRCNYILGWFRDDSERFASAAEYLNRKPRFKLNLSENCLEDLRTLD